MSDTFPAVVEIFLSTPSGWRATGAFAMQEEGEKIFLSTPSGWRATIPYFPLQTSLDISIHALRVEGDTRNLS